MKLLQQYFRWAFVAGFVLAGLAPSRLAAFPPAPHHSVYGMVRDEQGNPLVAAKATVYLELDGRVIASSPVDAKLNLGVNYRLLIPVDAGITSDKYQPTALLPQVPFRLRVVVGNQVYLPIEMRGASSILVQPAGVSQVDLTLGEDTDGDGLPDAWERSLIAAMRSKKTIADIRPEDDADGDGVSNLKEYLAGTYAFDPKEGFALSITSVANGRAQLEFTGIRGRSYTVHASTDSVNWEPVAFALPNDAANAPLRDRYEATDVRVVRVLVPVPTTATDSQPRLFRLMVH